MSVDKYPSIFLHQMKAVVYILINEIYVLISQTSDMLVAL